MLVLSRFTDEIIDILLPDGQRIEVQVVAVRGDKVRLGVTAPTNIEVHRREITEKIALERSQPCSDA